MGNKSLIFIFVLSIIVLYGCTSPETAKFNQGVKRINEIDKEFGSTMKAPPDPAEGVDELLARLTGFAATIEDIPTSLKYLLDFRIAFLEAEKLHIEGWQWGKGSTTDYGFGCRKGSARVLNSSKIRNSSAQKGFEALESLQLLVDEFPAESKSVNLTQKDVLFLNAAYQQVSDKASRDSRIIRSLCKKQIKEFNITI